jgi:hypothetical protein
VKNVEKVIIGYQRLSFDGDGEASAPAGRVLDVGIIRNNFKMASIADCSQDRWTGSTAPVIAPFEAACGGTSG